MQNKQFYTDNFLQRILTATFSTGSRRIFLNVASRCKDGALWHYMNIVQLQHNINFKIQGKLLINLQIMELHYENCTTVLYIPFVVVPLFCKVRIIFNITVRCKDGNSRIVCKLYIRQVQRGTEWLFGGPRIKKFKTWVLITWIDFINNSIDILWFIFQSFQFDSTTCFREGVHIYSNYMNFVFLN